nr:PREDICTED: X-ray radiation resistance-associated protein 1 isoform X2 [Anolis carolinensis]|eukprot:XP_016852922.1 PREDICTED: X-ray radiation resistance-associated protein 1 isoform X2 [Anolis carolinensis]
MATKAVYKLDDGDPFPTNCFPARNLLRPRYEEGVGHWQVARRTAEQTKIKLLFGTRSTQIKWQEEEVLRGNLQHLNEKTLDRTQLMQLHHVKSPTDLCSVDVSNRNFSSAKEEDFEQFTSVAYINATENLLTLDVFRTFPELRELELSLNGLRNLKVNAGDFPHLEVLDLSYNNLSPEDVQALGVLSHLKVLHLTANGLSALPLDLAVPESEESPRFPALEVLLLDDNHLSHPNVFVSLANLQNLKQLNLDRNGIREVPYLQQVEKARFSIHPLSAKSGIKEGLRSRKKAGKQLHQDQPSKRNKTPDYIILQNSKDPERTEVIFPSWTPESPTQEPSPSPPPSPQPDPKTSCVDEDAEFTLPLPELRFLSLADNEVEHEEDLLAVALFPSLAELTFHGNPFTTSRSGEPPLLTSFLQNKLGIKLVRKKISKLEKPRIFIPIKANRKVKSQLPKVKKRPLMIDAPLETTFWQLWTGADLDPQRSQPGMPPPLPSIKSIGSEPNRPILLMLNPEDRSAPYSLSSSFSADDFSGFHSLTEQLQFGTALDEVSSLDNLLFSNVSTARPQSPLPHSSVEEQHQRELEARIHRFLKEQNLRDFPGPPTPIRRTPPALARPDQSPEIVPPVTSEAEHLPPVPLLQISLPEETLSELVPPMETSTVEEEVPKSSSVSGKENLSEDIPPEDNQLESIPPASSSPLGLDQLESFSPSGSLAGDLPEAPSPDASHLGDHLAEVSPSQSSALSGQDLLDFPEPVPPSDSLIGEEDIMGSLPSSVEHDLPEEQTKPKQESGAEMSLASGSEGEDLQPREMPRLQKISPKSLSPSRSSSRELYELFAQAHLAAIPSGNDDEFSSEMCSPGEESPAEGKSGSFFMTQLDEVPTIEKKSPKERKKRKSLKVPEKYRGYEELLGGDPGPDFVEPLGIQHNVQALEKVLRYPLVYRDGKARLDSFQKPYVPTEKTKLRSVPQKPQKPRAEQLEEILLEMRKPKNIVHVPLVCILEHRKENWLEYRKALELLKEFREDYQAAVATCNKKKAKPVSKKSVVAAETDQGQALRSLLEVKGSSRPQAPEPPPKDEELTPKDEELTPKDEEPTPKAEDPTPKAEDPTPKEEEPTPKEEEPTPIDEDPTLKEEDPTPKDEDPTPKDEEPTPKDGEPTPKDGEPTPKDEEPTPKDEEPTPKDGEPTPKDGEPTPKDEEPTPKDEEPTVDTEEPPVLEN